MHAYLITGRNSEGLENKIVSLVKDAKARRLGFELRKIADVRNLSKFTNLGLSEKTAIVIQDIDGAGIDAQNAFLKALEEPQENLIYILTAQNQDSLLPTVVSRCQVIELGSAKKVLDEKAKNESEGFLKATQGEKLKIISKITKREDAIRFVENLIFILEPRLKKTPLIAFSLESLLEAAKRLKANGNVQLQLTTLVISLESLHI